MNVFDLHKSIISDYSTYIHSFINIRDESIGKKVKVELSKGKLWPEPLIQFNPSFEQGESIEQLVEAKTLHPGFIDFLPYTLHKHQSEAIKKGANGESFVVTSGTGSGKSLTYLSTIFNDVLINPDQGGLRAIVVYPMNALINSQEEEIKKYAATYNAKTQKEFPIICRKYSGQESESDKIEIINTQPHVLLTNYMMLELIMTRTKEAGLRELIFQNLKYLVFDELHTYRGRQGSDVALLVRRIKAQCKKDLIFIGTSATMASEGTAADKKNVVADVAQKFFASEFTEKSIIPEYLTPQTNWNLTINQTSLIRSIEDLSAGITEKDLSNFPLAVWLERKAVLKKVGEHYDRATPLKWQDLVELLSKDTGLDKTEAESALVSFLQICEGINKLLTNEKKRYSYFPYKLHQFINQTGAIWVTLEPHSKRLIEMDAKLATVPEEGSLKFYQIVFSRITGHDYFCVSKSSTEKFLQPRLFKNFNEDDDDLSDGYFIMQNEQEDELWNEAENIEDLPENWLSYDKHGNPKVSKNYRSRVPELLYVNNQGEYSEKPKNGYLKGWFISADSPFEMASRTIYERDTRASTMYSSLGVEGRSTSTDVIAYSVIKNLHAANVAVPEQKMLSFTDNRQDTALQAGHFNDFVKSGLLRSALYHALERYGTLDYLDVNEKVFEELQLTQLPRLNELVQKPADSGYQHEINIKAVKSALLYRLLYDLKRGWRVIMPNLEQCGLLKIEYKQLVDLASQDRWTRIPLFSALSVERRAVFLHQLLDYFRKLNAIRLDVLKQTEIDRNYKEFRDNLSETWLFTKSEALLYPRYLRLEKPSRTQRKISTESLGSRTAPARFVRNFFRGAGADLKGRNYDDFMQAVLNELSAAGYLVPDTNLSDVVLYQLNGIYIQWHKGNGETVPVDEIKNPSITGIKSRVNEFFKLFYKTRFSSFKPIKAAEHSGQLKNEYRERHESLFRSGDLSVLCCSPTMELGIDISDLNVVHMRNVPPSPANYTQRSGRAGRSGQGGLIFTFCSAFNAHDQHYFRNHVDMVAGIVKPPQLDFSNEELIVTHLNSLWLAEVNLDSLNSSIKDIVEESDVSRYLALNSVVEKKIRLQSAEITNLKLLFEKVTGDKHVKAATADWLKHEWIERKLSSIHEQFDKSFNRWRELYKLARKQMNIALATIGDPTIPAKDDRRLNAEKDKNHANRQIFLLRNDVGVGSNRDQSEFYPFRYLAAEGFLPGYNFTRLPVRIYIPYEEEGQYISRSRHLALREFGPRNQLYYMGTKFRSDAMPINKIDESLVQAKVVTEDGYILIEDDYNRNIAPLNKQPLNNSNVTLLHNLVNLQECRAEEQGRITCEEEERITQGFDIKTYFTMRGNLDRIKKLKAYMDNEEFLEITFLPAAKIFRINHKWRSYQEEGFMIGETTGRWKRNKSTDTLKPGDEPVRKVKIFTDTTSDAIYIKPLKGLNLNDRGDGAVTLMYALKQAIENVFEIENNEIGAELVGNPEEPNLLIYEASEGSLGILRKMVDDNLFTSIASEAYNICHFNLPDEEAAQFGTASYHDLLSYYNQYQHQKINRLLIKDALQNLMRARYDVLHNVSFNNLDEHYMYLSSRFDPKSSTEKKFLEYLYKNNYRLPDEAQVDMLASCSTIPDFLYKNDDINAAVFCDGIHHDDETTKKLDEGKRQCLANKGLEVIVWHYATPLDEFIGKYPHVFKKVKNDN